MEEALTCPIGFEIYNESQHKPFTLDICGHTFCINCIQMLPNKICPQCRKEFKRTNPNYTLIDIISSKSKHDLIKFKNEETKCKLKQYEEFLNEFQCVLEEGKKLSQKNLNDLKEDIHNCANGRINEINTNKEKLLNQVEDIEKRLLADYERYETKHELTKNKYNKWEDLSQKSDLTTKEKDELNNELKNLEIKIDDCKNVTFNMLSSIYTQYDFVPLGEISSFVTRFTPLQQNKKSENIATTTIDSNPILNETHQTFSQANNLDFKRIKLKGHVDTVHCICHIPNSNLIISGSEDKTIKIWNLETGNCLTTLIGHSNLISSLIMISNRYFASGGWDNLVKIWDLNTNKCVKTLKGHEKWVQCLSLTKTGQLISGSFDNTIKIWDIIGNNSKCVKTLNGHSLWIICLKVINNKLISGSRDKCIKIWSLDKFECERTLIGHENDVLCLDLTKSNQLISGSGDRTIKLWNIDSGILLQTFECAFSVWSLRSISDRYFVSGHENGELIIWDLNKNVSIKSLIVHPSFILDINLFYNNSNNEHILSYSCQNKSILIQNNSLNKIISNV